MQKLWNNVFQVQKYSLQRESAAAVRGKMTHTDCPTQILDSATNDR